MPTEKQATVLLVEDDAPQRRTLEGFLSKRGYVVLEADSADAALAAIGVNRVDLLLTDLRLGGPDGIDLLHALRQRFPDLQAIVLTAYGTVDDAVRAMRSGAYDFVSKPVDLSRLEALLEKALEKVTLSRENRGYREVIKSEGAFAGMVGESAAMTNVVNLAAKAAPSQASILILGESGTGKEVLARGIHLASKQKHGPFIAVSCAALPESLIESELFGHEAGAFTGATATKKGRFELANGGTLFLDEVGEIPLSMQVKLLNVLQSGRFERLGGTETLSTDVRIIAATNRNLEQQVKEGSFREDLYYRLNVVALTLPALRERNTDIPLLVAHFLAKQADLTGAGLFAVDGAVLEAMAAYPFPGNVRELENWIERAVVLAQGEPLTKEDFPDALFQRSPVQNDAKGKDGDGLDEQLATMEISLIKQALERNGGNQSAAARDLKITERAIRYKIKKHGL